MPRYAFVNGEYIRHGNASVHVEDRGFQFADGVYEVVACINGKLADERGHLDRLERSLDELSMAMPVTRNGLQFIMRELLRRNRLKNAVIYIQVTRGQAKRDFPFPKDVPASLILTARPFSYDGNAKVKTGGAAITVADIRWKRRDIKTTMLLAQVMAKQKAVDAGAYDAWLVDEDGFVTEASASNAWIVKGGRIITRQVTTAILRGVTRTALERIVSGLQLRLEERPFTPAEAYAADEAFTTSATALVIPITSLDGKKIGAGEPGPVARKLYDEYRAYADGKRGAQAGWEAGLDDDAA